MTLNKVGRSKAAKARKIEITFHADNGQAHPAINVKVREWPLVEGLDESVAERAYDAPVETFWRDAQSIAHLHGYTGVFSEGRSGGWLVPYYRYINGKLQQWEDSPGQGPDKGYPTYPDVNELTERKRFVRFREEILDLLYAMPGLYLEYINE